MIQSSSAAHAKAYFSDALQRSDYYVDGQELQGQFFGRLGKRIGSVGAVTKDSFFALCENINPLTGDPLTPRKRDNRTTGYDINFHCPKSVSIINALSNDNHIIEIFQRSVHATMQDIEADALTRVRKDGICEDRRTGELLWAEFIHQTARPVDGSLPDPHLHSHCFVFNATWDEPEMQIKAGQFRGIKQDMPYYQARFHKILSDNLFNAGYQVRRTEKSFEIIGVPQQAIDLFSKRTNEIGEFAKAHGVTDAKAMSELGAKTRAKKRKGLGMAELKAEWRNQIKENISYDPGQEEFPIRFSQSNTSKNDTAEDCVIHAIKHAFERVSVAPARRLLAMAYRHSVGKHKMAIDEIAVAFRSDENIILNKQGNREYCTTSEVLEEERRMVELAQRGQGKFLPLYQQVPQQKLNEQQNAAIEYILTNGDQVSIIRGAAGSGKTTLMGTLVELIEQAGKEVFLVAPTAQASRGVLVEEGFANAQTVAKLLADKKMQRKLFGQVLIVDEAGLLGTREMTALLELAEKQDARIILCGDTRQHASVVRGDALRVLHTVGGIKAVEVTTIMRQKNLLYRAAVEDLASGLVKEGFLKLSDLGAIQNINPLAPNDDLVTDYVALVKKGRSVLVVSPTHKQGEAVTRDIRANLKASGLLGKRELAVKKLNNLNLTEAEKSDRRNFEIGQVIQFNQNVPNIRRGSIWTVQSIDEHGVKILNVDGDERLLPKDRPTCFDIYKETIIGLAKGDKVKITRNGFDRKNRRLNNGQYLEVASVSKAGDIELINKASRSTYRLSKDFGHIDHAYCTTSHSAQGKTVDEVLISQPSSTFTATDAKQFYVSVSRGRDGVKIYTDDREALLEYASSIGERQSALELLKSQLISRYPELSL